MNLIGTKSIETNRLLLRKVKKEDAKEAYNNWCSSDKVSKYVFWEKHKNVEETKELFEMWERDYENLDTFRWIVEIKDTNELIGTIDVMGKKYFKYDVCEIGYCYGEKFWNKGYASESLKAVIKYLFEEAGFEVGYANHLSNNPASGKVMEKAGLNKEGILRGRMVDKNGIRNDLVSYSITKDEYLNKKETV